MLIWWLGIGINRRRAGVGLEDAHRAAPLQNHVFCEPANQVVISVREMGVIATLSRWTSPTTTPGWRRMP